MLDATPRARRRAGRCCPTRAAASPPRTSSSGRAVPAADELGHGRLRGARRRRGEAGRDASASSARRLRARCSSAPVEAGTAAKIFTGSVIPDGADTVVRVEDTETSATASSTVRVALKRGANVRPRGEDVAPGRRSLARGHASSARPTSACSRRSGAPTVAVHRRPRVAIVSTGAELVEVDQTPGPGQVVNIERVGARRGGRARRAASPVVLPIARDRLEDIRARVDEAAAADVVLSTGGVSVGEFDFVKDALDALGVERLFWKVAQKPGKPLTFGTLAAPALLRPAGQSGVGARLLRGLRAARAAPLAGHTAIHLPVVDARLAARASARRPT